MVNGLYPQHENGNLFTFKCALYRWAVIKDGTVFERMTTHIGVNSIGVCRDSQLRALKLLKVVLEGEGREILKFGYKTMKIRWKKLVRALSSSKRFSLQKIEPQYCTFSHKVRESSPGNSSTSLKAWKLKVLEFHSMKSYLVWVGLFRTFFFLSQQRLF